MCETAKNDFKQSQISHFRTLYTHLSQASINLDMLSIKFGELNVVHKGKVHSHPQEQWGFLIEGSGIRIQGNEEIEVNKGDFWQTPGGVEHGIIGGPEGAKILDVFSPPRDEYKISGSGFGI